MRQTLHETSSDWIGHLNEYNRERARRLQQRCCGWAARHQSDIRREGDQFCGRFLNALCIPSAPANLAMQVAPFAPSQLLHPLQERREPRLSSLIIRRVVHEHADPPHPGGVLLCSRRQRPRHCRAANKRDELPAPHSILSSARVTTVGGTVRSSAFAVLRLITSSTLVGACTGRSAGLAPRKMRST